MWDELVKQVTAIGCGWTGGCSLSSQTGSRFRWRLRLTPDQLRLVADSRQMRSSAFNTSWNRLAPDRGGAGAVGESGVTPVSVGAAGSVRAGRISLNLTIRADPRLQLSS